MRLGACAVPDAHHRSFVARTGRFTGLRTSHSRPLSCPRARIGRRRLAKVFRAIQPFRLADDFRRGPGRERQKASQSGHLHPCQVSALFGRRPGRTRQLSDRSIRCRTPLHRLRGMLSLIPTVENWRDRMKPAALRWCQSAWWPIRHGSRSGAAIKATRWPRDFVRPEQN